ncbi:MAG: hypothetical protein ACREHG_09375 [Candidatus Saccharimonadales bacterium]
MILSVHAVFGAGVGWETYRFTGNIPLSIAVAFASHYFLDLFPHTEYLESVQESVGSLQKRDGEKLGDAVKIDVDFLAGFLVVGLIARQPLLASVFAFTALIPDGLTVVYLLKPLAFMTLHQRWHGDVIQYITKQKRFPAWVGVATQVIAAITGVALLIRP